MEVAQWQYSSAVHADMKRKVVVSQENVQSAKPGIPLRRWKHPRRISKKIKWIRKWVLCVKPGSGI